MVEREARIAALLKGEQCALSRAAALPVVGVTAWQMLFDHAQAREGQTVVVHGSAGNVGSYAVQLARYRKLQVIGTIFGGDPDYVRELGADRGD